LSVEAGGAGFVAKGFFSPGGFFMGMVHGREDGRGGLSHRGILRDKPFDEGQGMGKGAREERTGDSGGAGGGWTAVNLVVAVLAHAGEKNGGGGGLEAGNRDTARGGDEV